MHRDTAANRFLLDNQLALCHGSCIQNVIDQRCQMVGGVLDGLDIVGALVTKRPGARPQHCLRQPYRQTEATHFQDMSINSIQRLES